MKSVARPPFDARRVSAVAAGKVSGLATRLLGKGGGTALPGLVATRLDSGIVQALAMQLPCGSVVVSGTNGKTTTSRMLGAIVTDAGYLPLRNASGSNLMRGLASTLVRASTLLGTMPRHARALGLFEVDEAALPEVLEEISPRTVLLLDLFRDQLDRYGEVATVARHWEAALRALPANTRVVANADDPLVVNVCLSAGRMDYTFGVAGAGISPGDVEHASDVKACPRCGGPIDYTVRFFGHLGHYNCRLCGLSRPEPSLEARDVHLTDLSGSRFTMVTSSGEEKVRLPLPGLYNVYNALGAGAAAASMEIDLPVVAGALARVTPAFGRMEHLEVDGRTVVLALAKNPAGLNEVLRTILTTGEENHLLVMLNDRVADGRDVSWIWDADVEMLRGRVAAALFSGTRAEDMGLRFKYAGVISPDAHPPWSIEHDTERALRLAVAGTAVGHRLFVVPTYTALLDVRGVLSRLGFAGRYWEE